MKYVSNERSAKAQNPTSMRNGVLIVSSWQPRLKVIFGILYRIFQAIQSESGELDLKADGVGCQQFFGVFPLILKVFGRRLVPYFLYTEINIDTQG